MSKKIRMIAMALLAMLNVAVCAQNLRIDKVEVGGREIIADGRKYDLGVLLADKDVCKVTISNISNGPLTFHKPKTSCGCLGIVDYDKMSIPSEGQMSFSFNYNTKYGNHDKGNKTITISAEDKNGELSILVMRVQYYALRYRSELAFMERNGKWGAMDINQKTVIPFEYEGLEKCDSDWIKAQRTGKWGLIDKSNKVLIPFEYDDMLIPFEYESLEFNREKQRFYIRAQKNGKFGIINEKNKMLVPFEYDDIKKGFRNGLCPVKRNGKWGAVDKNNHVIIPFEYDEISDAFKKLTDETTEIYIDAKKNGKWGVMNNTNQMVVPFEYEDYVYLKNDGCAIVKKNGKWGKVDKNNKVVTQFVYDDWGDVK